MSPDEYEKKLLSLPIAGRTSGEDDQHKIGDSEFVAMTESVNCGCDRCRIIRLKKRKAFRFSQSRCVGCGNLFTSIFDRCDKCRES